MGSRERRGDTIVRGKLQRLEIENFKSYKGQQVIGPFSDFTAIIGPNGSGKSNLMDAISFVLGDVTRNLRVRRLNELIHGAVVDRPAARTASVTAVYEAENGDETRFSRIIHGNTSEYRINDRPVRVDEYASTLEKIQIFMKGKNFLVFQGAVENIAMKNPKERCQMFEEISKSNEFKDDYDKARSEMQHAEEETQHNYNKKKGMVAEKREAKLEKDEAEKYKKLKDELSNKQLELFLFKLYYNEQDIKTVQGELEQKQGQLEEEDVSKRTVEKEVADRRKDLAKIHKEQSSLEAKHKECEADISDTRPKLIRLKEKRRHLMDKARDCSKLLENARSAHESHESEIRALEEQLELVVAEREEWEQRQTQQYQSQGRSLELEESQVQEYNHLKQQVAANTAGIQARLDQLDREYKDQKDKYEALERRRQDILSSFKRKESELGENQKRLTKLEEYITNSKNQIGQQKKTASKMEAEVQEANKRMQAVSDELADVLKQLSEANVEHTETRRQIKRRELIENLKRLFPGVYGRLIEMCSPSHSKYKVAITKVLGKYMDAIVCDTEKTAKECIQHLKDHRIEPETFLPLDYLDVRPIDERLRETMPENVHLVIDVLQYEQPIIKKALQFACGNALVCETKEDARRVAFRTGERKKTVSLDGTLFQRSGIISGGASDLKARARRWDEKQLSSLNARKEKLSAEMKELMKKKRKEGELKTIHAQIYGLETRLKYTEKDRETTESKLKGANEADLSNIEGDLEDVNRNANECQATMQEIQMRSNDEKREMDNVEDNVFRDFCQQIGVDNIRQYEERELRVARDRDKKKMEFQNQEQRLRNQLEYERSRDTEAAMRKFQDMIDEEKAALEKLKADEQRVRDDFEAAEARKSGIEERVLAARRRQEEMEAALSEVRKRLGARQKEVQRAQKEITQTEARLESKRAARHGLLKNAKMEGMQLPLRAGSMEDILTDEDPTQDTLNSEDAARIYENEAQLMLDYRHLDKGLRRYDDLKEVSKKVESMAKEVDSMTHQLNRIQAPNLRAGDKLSSVEQQLYRTEAEFEDTRRRARKAKAHFETMKRRRHERFMDCFNRISDNIDQIYKSISRNPGAQASLLPTNPEEPYLDEIQFQCVAPGKRFQQMDSLSGGEKTVAALALLFATHRYNPAPFFVLDEIDAALDNTNIGKVASFIQEYSKTSCQVVVISLKEEFYSKADALIGIYPDLVNNCLVSRVLTLDLSGYEEGDTGEDGNASVMSLVQPGTPSTPGRVTRSGHH